MENLQTSREVQQKECVCIMASVPEFSLAHIVCDFMHYLPHITDLTDQERMEPNYECKSAIIITFLKMTKSCIVGREPEGR